MPPHGGQQEIYVPPGAGTGYMAASGMTAMEVEAALAKAVLGRIAKDGPAAVEKVAAEAAVATEAARAAVARAAVRVWWRRWWS